MINLFNTNLVKKTTISCPQRDGFELENLIENLDNKNNFSFFTSSKNNGFVSDTFIRPPVQIEIIFNEPVNIQKIILDTKVNTQISNGLVIFSTVESLKTLEIDREKFTKSFYQIAKVVNDKDRNLHVYEFLKRDNNSEFNSNIKNVFFSTKSPNYLTQATGLRIVIIKTFNSTSPCLKSIKILGSISDEKSCTNLSVNSSQLDKMKKVKIPDEFIDELTHEMMRMPIRLPSKKYIDQTTLDKYLAEIKKNNERDKDPFTCVDFSSSYKPVLDGELKAKIDRFLFENSNCILEINEEPSCSLLKRTESKRKIEVDSQSCQRPKRLKSSLEIAPIKCNSCFNIKNDNKLFYKLETCEHVFCRFCLLAMKNKCRLCHKEFKNNQIINIDRTYLK